MGVRPSPAAWNIRWNRVRTTRKAAFSVTGVAKQWPVPDSPQWACPSREALVGLMITFSELQRSVFARLPRARGGNLQGFMFDAWHFLARSDVIASVALESPRRGATVLRAAITFGPKATSIGQATNELLGAVRALTYWSFSSVWVVHAHRMMEVSFITVPSGKPYYVSGTLVVHGPRYESLMRKERMVAATGRVTPSWVETLSSKSKGHRPARQRT